MVVIQSMTDAPQPMRTRPLTLIVILLGAATVLVAIVLGWGRSGPLRAAEPTGAAHAAPNDWKS